MSQICVMVGLIGDRLDRRHDKGGFVMRIVVIGGSGLIGSKVVRTLAAQGHEVVAASPSTGVDTLTGDGLAEAMEGTAVVIDVSNSPSFEDAAVLEFFRTSTGNVVAAERATGVGHHVTLSVVGTERLSSSGYFRAKLAQEDLINSSPIPHSIVRATQFFEFMKGIAESATDGDTVRLAPVHIQPMASTDVAALVGRVATGQPLNGTVEIAGPEVFRLDELVQHSLSADSDPRRVLADVHATYFGAELGDRTLVPDAGAWIGATRFEDWLAQSMVSA
jgi:uncharacterized protein YbjT (DUF2867 family)